VAKPRNEITNVPPQCPRCGNKSFKPGTLYRSFKTFRSEKLILECTECELKFDGSGWWDEAGAEWTMAESGT
jgi:hypothetical protein